MFWTLVSLGTIGQLAYMELAPDRARRYTMPSEVIEGMQADVFTAAIDPGATPKPRSASCLSEIVAIPVVCPNLLHQNQR